MQASVKVRIVEVSTDQHDRTAHLQPVIEFLIQHGNVPYTSKFVFDQKGKGTFFFKYPINIQLLKSRFDFPATVSVIEDSGYKGGYIFDRMNALEVRQDM